MDSFLGQLSEPLFDELDRLRGIKGQVEWTEKEMRLMLALLEKVKKEQPGDYVDKWTEEAEKIFRDVEDLIKIFNIKTARNARRAPFKMPVLSIEDLKYRLKVSKKLEKIKFRMGEVCKRRPTTREEEERHRHRSSSQASCAVDSVIQKIDNLLSRNWIVLSGVVERVMQIRFEFTKLLSAVDVKPEMELDQREKAWMEETKCVADFAENIFSSFLREENFKIPSSSISKIPYLHPKDLKLGKDMARINIKIQDLYDIKWTYGIGDFKGREMPTSMVPMGGFFPPPVKTFLKFYLYFFFFLVSPSLSPLLLSSFHGTLLSSTSMQELASWKPVSEQLHSVHRDLKLVRALVRDVDGMEGLDKRVETWLAEMKDIQCDAEALDTFANQERRGWVRDIKARPKVAMMIKRINKKIHGVSQRKWTYDIGKIEGRQGLSSASGESTCTSDAVGRRDIGSPSNQLEQKKFHLIGFIEDFVSFFLTGSAEKLEEQVESIKRELKLMQAFFKDFDTMEEQDARLKAWMVELRGVEEYAQRFINSYDNNTESKSRWKVRMEIDRINNDIREISKRKSTYDIGGKGRRLVSTYQMEERRHATRSPILEAKLKENIGWIQRELILIDALSKDVKEMGTVDESLKIWVEFMEAVADDAGAAIKTFGQNGCSILKRWKFAKKIESIVSKIQDVSEIRFAYGIEYNEGRKTCETVPPVVDPRKLPLYLKRCFFYFGLFPANFEIPVRRLIMLWIAEGLVPEKKGDEEPRESVAKRYLTELIDGDIVKVTKHKLNGEVKKCRLRDGLQSEAKKGNPLIKQTYKVSKSNPLQSEAANPLTEHRDEISKSAQRTSMTLRLSDHYNEKDDCFSHIHGNNNTNPSTSTCNLLPDYKDVITFLSFDTREESKAGEEVGKFLDRCISNGFFLSLRVLDLERVFRPQLPKTLGQLITLRYLGLRWTYLQTLPSFISKLLNLQALDVKHTYISTLPSSVWKMEQLRHLYLNESYRCRFMRRPSRCSLTNLQTLWGAFIDEDSPVKNGLDTLTNLRKLGLACRIMSFREVAMSSQLIAVAEWVLKLKHLQSLRLKSYNELGEPGNLPLQNLSNHPDLSSVYLLGRLENASVVSQFPKNIVEVTLSASGLAENPMQTLKEFPNLIILQLFSESYTGKDMVCSPDGFPQLKVLKLWKLEKLEKWEVEKGALPTLEDLEIRSCVKLEMLPDGLRHVRTLKKLKLSNMLKECMDRIEYQGQDWDKIAHVPDMYIEDTLVDKGTDVADHSQMDRIEHQGQDWDKIAHVPNIYTLDVADQSQMDRIEHQGQDWDKIEHVPNISIDDTLVDKGTDVADESQRPLFICSSSTIWKKLYCMSNIHERHRLFIWRIYTATLPSELPIGSIACPFCGAEPESAVHLFFLCKPIKMIWFAMCGVRTDDFSLLSISDWITHILNPSLIFGDSPPSENYFLHSAVIIMEKTWLWRNRSIFDRAEFEPDLIYREIRSAFNEKSNARVTGTRSLMLPTCPPDFPSVSDLEISFNDKER